MANCSWTNYPWAKCPLGELSLGKLSMGDFSGHGDINYSCWALLSTELNVSHIQKSILLFGQWIRKKSKYSQIFLCSFQCNFFFHFPVVSTFSKLCNGNSLAGLVNFFGFERKRFSFFFFFIFLLFLHLCNRNSLAGLVHLFRIERGKLFFSLTCCLYVYVMEIH